MKVFALGGSSSIGQAAIRVLLDAGHEVCGTFRTRVPQGLDGATWVRADVRSTADLDALPEPAEGAEVLLLLPGLSLGRTLGTYEDDQVSEVVDVNFSGQFRAIQRIAPVLADGSHILILGSQAGQRGSSDPLYGATKGAMHALAKSLAKSLAPRTRVNVRCARNGDRDRHTRRNGPGGAGPASQYHADRPLHQRRRTRARPARHHAAALGPS